MKKALFLLVIISFYACQEPKARRPVSQVSDAYIKDAININKKLVAQEEALIQKIIKEDTEHNYITSSNGFWYFYNTKITGDTLVQPKTGSQVRFTYNLAHLNDEKIYTQSEIGIRTNKIDQQNLMTGLRQGLKLMKVGETVTFLFPSYKAFGYYGDQKRIGINVPIKSTVTLLAIKKDTINQTQPLNIKK